MGLVTSQEKKALLARTDVRGKKALYDGAGLLEFMAKPDETYTTYGFCGK